MPLLQSTVHKFARKLGRSMLSEFVTDFPLLLHWDEKILLEIFGNGYVDHACGCFR